MRAPWLLLVVAGCAHQAPPPPPTVTPPPAGGPRLSWTAGETLRGRAKVTVEAGIAAAQGSNGDLRRVQFAFSFLDEQHVDAVAADGTAQLTVHFTDVKVAASDAVEPAQVDGYARALGQLQVRFSRTARGEVAALELSNIQPPLEEQNARGMLTNLYSAMRGPFLPETAAQKQWVYQKALPADGAFTGGVRVECTLTRDDAVGCDGHVDGRGGNASMSRRMEGRSTAEYRVEGGKLRLSVVDSELTVRQEILGQQTLSTGMRQHVRAEWTRQ